MNRNITELKRIARGNLTFRYKIPMWAVLFSYLIALLIDTPFSNMYNSNPTTSTALIYLVSSLFGALLVSLLTYGQLFVALKMSRLQNVTISDLFVFFKNQPDRYLLGSLILIGIGILYGLPFFLLSLIADNLFGGNPYLVSILNLALMIMAMIVCSLKLITLTLFPFYLIDNFDMSVPQCFSLANAKAKGHIKRIILTHFSFVGWLLLGFLTFGIGYIWIVPYYIQTITTLYMDITGELSSLEYQKIKPKEPQISK